MGCVHGTRAGELCVVCELIDSGNEPWGPNDEKLRKQVSQRIRASAPNLRGATLQSGDIRVDRRSERCEGARVAVVFSVLYPRTNDVDAILVYSGPDARYLRCFYDRPEARALESALTALEGLFSATPAVAGSGYVEVRFR